MATLKIQWEIIWMTIVLETLYYLLLPLVLHIIWSRLYITHCIRACIKNFDYLTVLNSLFYINSWLTCWLALKNVGGKDTQKNRLPFSYLSKTLEITFKKTLSPKIYQIERILNKQFSFFFSLHKTYFVAYLHFP